MLLGRAVAQVQLKKDLDFKIKENFHKKEDGASLHWCLKLAQAGKCLAGLSRFAEGLLEQRLLKHIKYEESS